MTIPRGFTRCDECEGEGEELSDDGYYVGPCPDCSGSGLVPTNDERVTLDEALGMVDGIVTHIWDRSIGDQEDMDLANAVEVLANAAREYRKIKRISIDVSSLEITTGPPIEPDRE